MRWQNTFFQITRNEQLEVVSYACRVWLIPTQMFVNGKCHFEEKKKIKNKLIFVAGKPFDLQKWESCIQKRFQKLDLGLLLFFHASSRHWQLYLYLVSRGHLSNVWSQSSHWQPRSIQMHPAINCFHHALFFFNIPENMSNRTLFFLLW